MLVDQSLDRQQAWDQACTAHGTAFYSAASRGTCTYFFANLHQHTFTPLVRINHFAALVLLTSLYVVITPAHAVYKTRALLLHGFAKLSLVYCSALPNAALVV